MKARFNIFNLGFKCLGCAHDYYCSTIQTVVLFFVISKSQKKDYAKKHIIWEQKIGASWFFSQLLRVRVMREWVWRARTLLLSRMYIHKTLNTLCYIKIIIYRVPICIQRTGDWAIDISRPTNMPRLFRVGSDVPK